MLYLSLEVLDIATELHNLLALIFNLLSAISLACGKLRLQLLRQCICLLRLGIEFLTEFRVELLVLKLQLLLLSVRVVNRVEKFLLFGLKSHDLHLKVLFDLNPILRFEFGCSLELVDHLSVLLVLHLNGCNILGNLRQFDLELFDSLKRTIECRGAQFVRDLTKLVLQSCAFNLELTDPVLHVHEIALHFIGEVIILHISLDADVPVSGHICDHLEQRVKDVPDTIDRSICFLQIILKAAALRVVVARNGRQNVLQLACC